MLIQKKNSVFLCFHPDVFLRVTICVVPRSKDSTVFCSLESHVLRQENLKNGGNKRDETTHAAKR